MGENLARMAANTGAKRPILFIDNDKLISLKGSKLSLFVYKELLRLQEVIPKLPKVS